MKEFSPIIGHRGVATLAPENTLESFAMAHSFGLRAVEFDVVLSADGDPFVFHDLNLRRTTNGRGEIGLVSSAYLQSLDAGAWFSPRFIGAKIPTLRDTLLWLSERQMTANIEIKPYPGSTASTVASVLKHLEDIWPATASLPLISSFDLEAMHLCRQKNPNLPLGYLLDRWQLAEIEIAASLNCRSIHLSQAAITQRRVEELKARGFLVYVYTVNYQSLLAKYFSWGVDGAFSDYPYWRGI